jgi:hypothetical protein
MTCEILFRIYAKCLDRARPNFNAASTPRLAAGYRPLRASRPSIARH